jgi:hypothetical protein
MFKIYESKYKNQDSLVLESEKITAVFLPNRGSKMTSLLYKPKNLELMVQRKNRKYRIENYEGDYLNGECSGFDEMFPTISECYYTDYPWVGTKIPDHGEVWPLKWEYKIENSLVMEVAGVRFPYRLRKSVYFSKDNTIKIKYSLLNISNFNFYFLWAAHTMFVLEDDSELILPRGVEKIITVMSKSGRLGKYGDEFSWANPDLDLSKIRKCSAKDCEKYYIKGKMPEGWCLLRYGQSGVNLKLSFPTNRVPYLGVLTNECGWDNLYNIFLEPCTSSFDRPDIARLRGECSSVKARSKYEWFLDIRISNDFDQN